MTFLIIVEHHILFGELTCLFSGSYSYRELALGGGGRICREGKSVLEKCVPIEVDRGLLVRNVLNAAENPVGRRN